MTDPGSGFSSGLGRYTFGPGRHFVTLAEQVASTLLGRRVDLRFGRDRAEFTLRALHLGPTPFGVATGRLDRVDVGLDEVRWEGAAVDRMEVAFHEVRVAPGFPRPAVVAGPVEVRARLGQETLDRWLGLAGLAVGVTIGEDGYLHVTSPGRGWGRWGHAAMTAEVHGHEIRLRAAEVVVGGRHLRGPTRFVPPVLVPVPHLPRGLQLRTVAVDAGEIHVEGVIAQVREPITLGQLEQTARAVARLTGTAGVAELVLPRFGH